MMRNRLLSVPFGDVTKCLLSHLSRPYSHKVANIVLYHYYIIIIIIKIIYQNAGHQLQFNFSEFLFWQCDR